MRGFMGAFVKGAKQLLFLRATNPPPLVTHHKGDSLSTSRDIKAHIAIAIRRKAVFAGIIDQIKKNLTYRGHICLQLTKIISQSDRKRSIFLINAAL